MNSEFHLSLPCQNAEVTKQFYVDDLGFELGRSSALWFDVNLFGHQITFVESEKFIMKAPNYVLEDHILPLFHFGVILDENSWEEMYDRVNHWTLDITPKKTFFKDKNGEHRSFFISDPNEYKVEFKTFVKNDSIFMI